DWSSDVCSSDLAWPAPAGDRPARATLGSRVGPCTLTAGGQAATVTDAAVAADFDQPLNVLSHLLAKLAFDGVVLVDVLANAGYFVVGEVAHLCFERNVGGRADLVISRAADAEDITKRDPDSLLP